MVDGARGDLDQVASIDILTRADGRRTQIPLSALGHMELVPQRSTIPRRNGQRVNIVQGFLKAGVLPSAVLAEFKRTMAGSALALPEGYRLSYGGEADKRKDAINNLMASVGLLATLMAATLVLSFHSFRLAGLIAMVGILAVGLGMLGLRLASFPFGFIAIVGTMGLIGVAINDAIVVLAAIRGDAVARRGDIPAMRDVVIGSTRHVVSTTITTIAGFTPLFIGGGEFWPPLAVVIAGGVGGATLLALYFVPSAYRLLMVDRAPATAGDDVDEALATTSAVSIP
jgi:multidrug efflux pump subunit AcrB